MVSDAISTGKPVDLVPVRSTAAGWFVMALMDRIRPTESHSAPRSSCFLEGSQGTGLGWIRQQGRGTGVDLNCSAVSRAKAIVRGLLVSRA